MATVRKLAREPLLHFLILGAVIFAVYAVRTRHNVDKPGEIVVTQGAIENLVTGFTRTWQRPPTEEEFNGLLRDYVRQEAAYREALALGLDRDDMIVRRRLQQKLEFLSAEVGATGEPGDDELNQFPRAHTAAFRSEPRVWFQQIYFNPQLRGGDAHARAAALLAALQHAGTGRGASQLGDPFLLEPGFKDLSLTDVKKTFGEKFAASLAVIPVGAWQGPLDSGYGVHLVLLEQRSEGRLPALAEVRDQVRREWQEAKRREATDKLYEAILKRYTVRIEPVPTKTVAQSR
jgi:hypothetical protein